MVENTLFFHGTSAVRAAAILRDGFEDREYSLGTDANLLGVFLADRPLDANEGVATSDQGDPTFLAVDFSIPSSALDDYEVVAEQDQGYREWCVPASLIRRSATVRMITEDDEAKARPFPPLSG